MKSHWMIGVSALLVLSLLIVGSACRPSDSSNEAAATEGSVPVATVLGKISSTTGEPLALAHVHVVSAAAPDPPLESHELGPDGRFELQLELDRGLELRFTAVHHQRLDIPLIVEGQDTVEVEAHLAPIRFTGNPAEILVNGNIYVPGPNGMMQTPRLKRRDDGTYGVKVDETAERVRYWLTAPTEKGLLHFAGMQAEGFEYGPPGVYHSVLSIEGGGLELVFDPADLAISSDAGTSWLETDHEALELAFGLRQELDRMGDSFAATLYAGQKIGPSTRETFVADARRKAQEIFLDEDAPSAVRAYAASLLLFLTTDPANPGNVDSRFLDVLPTDAPAWSYATRSLALASLPRETLAGLHTAHPDPEVRNYALAGLVAGAKRDGDHESWKRLYADLAETLSDEPHHALLLKQLAPELRISVGKVLPDFEALLYDGNVGGETKISPTRLAGSFVLLDFWGTWCAPCIGEMPYLHEAWEQFSGRGLKIVSVATNGEEDLLAFREKWPMPWSHVLASDEQGILEAFEITAYPTTLLVDPDGKIVAKDESLRGEKLRETLERFLAEDG